MHINNGRQKHSSLINDTFANASITDHYGMLAQLMQTNNIMNNDYLPSLQYWTNSV